MLSSIKPQYTAAKRKVVKMSRIQIARTLRRDQPSSPKSFASPELGELSTPASEVPPMPSYLRVSTESEPERGRESSEEQHLDRCRETASSLPRVQLELTPGSLSDWSDLFSSDKFNFEGATPESLALSRNQSNYTTDTSAKTTVTTMEREVVDNADETVTDARGVAQNGIVDREPVMATGHHPPTFDIEPGTEVVGIQDPPIRTGVTEREDSLQNASSFWRPSPPSQLQIPDATFHEIEFQHTLGGYSLMDTLPRSAISDTLSPYTGATLARALIGNAFHFSDASSLPSGSTRHTSAITRSDSAVLPEGDTPQAFTPDWQSPPLSSSHFFASPSSDTYAQSDIPPVPPLPLHLFANGDLSDFTPKKEDKLPPFQYAKEPKSTTSLGSILASYVDGSPQLAEFLAERDVEFSRISRVTEAPSSGFISVPGTPPVSEVPPDNAKNGTSNHPAERADDTNNTNSASSSPNLAPDFAQNSAQPRQHMLAESHLSLTPTVNGNGSNELGDNDVAESSRKTAVSPPASDGGSVVSRPGSPNSSQWNDSYDTRKRPKGSKVALAMTLSPSGQMGKVDWVTNRNRSGSLGGDTHPQRSVALLPIGERPRSFLSSPSPNESRFNLTSSAKSSGATDFPKQSGSPTTSISIPSFVPESTTTRLVPTSTRNVFNRQRAGSTPSPIAVDRVSKDLDAYQITVAGATSGLTGPMFPETPSEFSPMWSPNSVASPLRAEVNELLSSVSPTDLFRTGSLYGTGPGAASLAQQLLISRAATSVRGARLANVNRPRITARSHPYARNIPLLTPPPEDPLAEDAPASPDQSRPDSPARIEFSRFEFPSRAQPSIGTRPSTAPKKQPTVGSQDNVLFNESAGMLAVGTSFFGLTEQASSDSLPRLIQLEGLHEVKPLPPRPAVTPDQSPANSRPSWNTFLEREPVDAPMPTPDSSTLPVQRDLLNDSPRSSPSAPASVATPPTTSSPSRLSGHLQQQQEQVSSPPPSQPPSSSIPPTFSGRSENSNSYLTHSFTLSLGAPPPYYSIVPEIGSAPTSELEPPFSRGSDNSSPSYSEFRGPPAESSPPPLTADSVISPGESTSSRHNRGARVRPRLPAGPRNPMSHSATVQRGDPPYPPGSSSGSNFGDGRRSNASLFVPKFQSPPMKWRGYTMDAAKWTFTSAQLQDIVSRAIRQSAEAYSIRLLRLETLDNDIPDEMHRLEMLGTDVKSRYKALSRKRQGLLQSLSAHLEVPAKGDPVAGLKLLDELAETSEALDRLAEELHSVDEQIANLRSLRDVHSASALAMALRKLNASFLRELSEKQALRQQVEILESERDEAWKHAEDVAHDFDDFTEKVLESNSLQTPISSKPASRRSSRVTAVRKSSVRALKAGLRPSRSQRSSVSSIYRASLSPLASSKNVLTAEDIPPVPPIPMPTPLGIETANLPSRSSMGISTGTPTSETRAMVKAQEELYAILGISPVETAGIRRRHLSMTGPPAALQSSTLPSSAYDVSNRANRPSYRPRSAGSAVLTL